MSETVAELNQPLVSVVVPVFNAETSVKRAIDSVLNQTQQDFELLLVNDCSTDGSRAVLDAYRNDARVSILENETNQGKSRSRNRAIESSRGRYIAFLDSDDVWRPQKIENQIAFMTEHSYPISYTGYTMVDVHDSASRQVSAPRELDYQSLLKYCFIGFLTAMYDTNVLGKRYFRDLPRREDYVFWLDILKEGYIAGGLNEDLAIYSRDSRLARKLSLARFHWRVYRQIEQMSLASATYYFLHYCLYGLRKHYI